MHYLPYASKGTQDKRRDNDQSLIGDLRRAFPMNVTSTGGFISSAARHSVLFLFFFFFFFFFFFYFLFNLRLIHSN